MFRRFLLTIFLPVQKILSLLATPRPKATSEWFFTIQDRIEPGDILLTREDWHFTNLLIPGFWSHAGIYTVNAEGKQNVVEAIPEGVKEKPLLDFVMDVDHICVLRPMVSKQDRNLAAIWASTLPSKNLKYDFNFEPGDNAFYCSEVCHTAYKLNSLQWSKMFVLKETFGVETVVPQDFRNAVRDEKLQLVAKFSSNKNA